MLPPWEEALVHPPTWVRGCGSNYHGREPVTLVMALEEEPRSSHANMIGAHLEVLLVWVAIGEDVLGTTPSEAPERRAVGFALLMFAAELASVLSSPEFGGDVAPEVRVAAGEAIAAATLRAGGCLASVVSEYLASVA
jgi:hypothetical protein